MNAPRHEMLAALSALALVAGAPEEGLQIGGLDQPDLPELAEHDSYEQMVLDYIDAVRRSTPNAWFGDDYWSLIGPTPDPAPSPYLWEPFDESHSQPLQVNFADSDERLFHPEGDQVMGLYWPGQRRIDVDPHYLGRWQTEATVAHELSRAAVDDFFGHHTDPEDHRFFNGPAFRDLRSLSRRQVGFPSIGGP